MKCQSGILESTDGAALPTNPPSITFSVLVFVATFLFDFNSNKPVPCSPLRKDEKTTLLNFIFLFQYFFLFVCPFVCAYDADVALIVKA